MHTHKEKQKDIYIEAQIYTYALTHRDKYIYLHIHTKRDIEI